LALPSVIVSGTGLEGSDVVAVVNDQLVNDGNVAAHACKLSIMENRLSWSRKWPSSFVCPSRNALRYPA
jgi:hypothetical protein